MNDALNIGPRPRGRPPKVPYKPGYNGKEFIGQCALCHHEQRYRAELMLAAGASVRAVAAKFDAKGISYNTVWVHWQNHVSAERKAQMIAGPVKLQELAERAAEENLTVLDYLRIIRGTLIDQFLMCAEAGDKHATAILSGRLLETLREVGKITGEIDRAFGNQITNNTLFYASPGFDDLRRMLMERLERHPEARAEVLDGLRQLERQVGVPEGALSQAPPQRVD
jgi:hypothetical protein